MSNRNWILLRGLARHKGHWGNFEQDFLKKFPGDHLEFLDLKGNGERSGEDSFLSLSSAVDDLRRKSKLLSKGEKVNLLSISLGGMLAVDWASRFPHEVGTLICINTSDRGTAPLTQRLLTSSYKTLFEILFKNPSAEVREKKILDLTCNLLSNKEEWAKKFSTYPSTSLKNFLKQITSAARFSFPKDRPSCVIKLLVSEKDRLVSSSCTERIGQMWSVTPVVHRSAGHDLPLDDPQWVITQLESVK